MKNGKSANIQLADFPFYDDVKFFENWWEWYFFDEEIWHEKVLLNSCKKSNVIVKLNYVKLDEQN